MPQSLSFDDLKPVAEKRKHAAANGITPEPTWNDCSSIHRFWDASDQGARDASWVKAMGEG